MQRPIVERVGGQGQLLTPSHGLNMGHYFLFFLLAVVLASCFHVLSDYSHTIIFAIILAIVFSPVHRRILGLTGGRANVAAVLSCAALTLTVVLPLFFVFLSLIMQGVESFNAIHAWINAGEYQKILALPLVVKLWAMASPYLPDVSKFFEKIGGQVPPANKAILDVTSQVGKFLVSQGGGLVGNLSAFIGKFFLMLFTFFFIIRDEEKIFRHFLHLIPLHSSHEETIIMKIKAVSRSVLLGTFLTAVAQGAVGGVAFWVTGLPALFWAAMMAFAALIPFVGTALIWVPAAVYLLLLGRWGAALFMVIWCSLVVGLLDNLIRPLFMKGAADMSTLLIFFAILGGLNTFGLIGLLYGPLLFGLAMVLLYIYEIEFAQFLCQQDHS
ncbi:MAG: AI-2E family transporter [Desulfobulbaceae bacterium]|nr:AI-2E family transporter [Desulfobulbaceae bacterium]